MQMVSVLAQESEKMIYLNSDNATVTAGKPTITKTADANLQILETTIMTLQVDIPVGTTATFVITDDLPSGLSYTGQAITIDTPAMNFFKYTVPSSTPGGGTDPLVFDFGTITNQCRISPINHHKLSSKC